ncbi:MAG: hypothetical protein ACRDA0_08195 [Cetobacterium sp.]|uniref:hypothetical protein n=1 Tax=Cetobacterium sp. TaxID=2071632 RepID=UPI003F3E5753
MSAKANLKLISSLAASTNGAKIALGHFVTGVGLGFGFGFGSGFGSGSGVGLGSTISPLMLIILEFNKIAPVLDPKLYVQLQLKK